MIRNMQGVYFNLLSNGYTTPTTKYLHTPERSGFSSNVGDADLRPLQQVIREGLKPSPTHPNEDGIRLCAG